MSEAVFMQSIENQITGIRLCVDAKLFMPALILIYSGIDFVSALTRPSDQQETDRNVFITWVDTYMPCQRLNITGADLYGARCGILHAMTSDSRLHAQGKAKRIFYAWGNAKTHPLNSLLNGTSNVFLKIEDLVDAFIDGITKFAAQLDGDEALRKALTARANKIFASYETLTRHSIICDE